MSTRNFMRDLMTKSKESTDFLALHPNDTYNEKGME